jgi:urease accessory protein
MDRDARTQRGQRPFLFTNIRQGIGVAKVVDFVVQRGLLESTVPEVRHV